MIIEIRKHMHGAWILALAMFFSFAIPPLINFVKLIRMRADAVAVVNGVSLTGARFRQAAFAYEAYLRSLRMMGLEKFIRHLGKEDILESCVCELLKQGMAQKFSILVHDKELAVRLAKELGQRYIADGVFDKEKYSAQIMASTGMKMSQYEERIREAVAGESIDEIIRMASPELFVPKENLSERKFSVIKLDKKSISDQLKKLGIDKKDLLEYYSNNKDRYLSDEERTFDAIFLDYEIFKDRVLVDQDEIFDYYQNTVSTSFTKPALYSIGVWEASVEGLSEEEVSRKLAQMQELQSTLAQTGVLTLSKNTLKDISAYSKEADELDKMGIDPVLVSAIAELNKAGAVTQVLKTDKNIFFAQVKSFTEPQVVPFEEANEKILPILQARALTVLARQEVEELIKEARENENGSDLIYREGEKYGLKVQKIFSTNDEDEKSNIDPVFKKSTEVQTGLIGCMPKENGLLIYSLQSFKPREALAFEDVVDEVTRDFLSQEADKKAKVLAAEIKKSILSGDEHQAVLTQWKGSEQKTDWVGSEGKVDGLEPHEFKKAFKMSQVGAEVFVFDGQESIKVVSLAQVKAQQLKGEVEDPLVYDSKRDYNFNEGILASDQRNAKIKYFSSADRRIDLEDV